MRRRHLVSCVPRVRTGWLSLPLLAALVVGLALLLPAAALAAGGRAAPADPEFLDFVRTGRAGRAAASPGYVPSPVNLAGVPRARFAALMTRFPSRFTSPAADRAVAAQSGSTAASYDLAAVGKLPQVRDQGRYGTCWAFATYASLESCLLPGAARDFSENNLAHRAGFSLGFDQGGNSYMAMAYLLRWAGPVPEADDPYAPYASTPNPSPANAAVPTHVHEVLELPPRTAATDNTNLKWAVMTYGAVYTSMLWSDAAYRASSAAYYFAGSGGNHAVACVGWDDAYPATAFATRPPGDGAFLVRNSWGTGFGDGGYFWVSYHDGAFAGQSAVFNGAEPAEAGDRIYQHDPLGWVASYRPPDATDPSTAWLANAFTPTEPGTLTAAGFYTTAPNATYQVRVASTVGAIEDAGASASGTLAVPGYHTVRLATPAALGAGAKVVIAVRLTVPGYRFPIAIERPYSGYSDATASTGQSYVSGNGSAWTDMTRLIAGTNVCLKGYGETTGAAPEPAPEPTPSPSPTPSPTPTPAASVPSVRLRDAAASPGARTRIVCSVKQAGAATGSATVAFIIRDRRGALVRRTTLRDVSLSHARAWRLRCPGRRGAYSIVAVATLDTGEVSKRATATLRVR